MPEVASTRALITAADLAGAGIPLREAAYAAIVLPLTDDEAQIRGLRELVDSYLPA